MAASNADIKKNMPQVEKLHLKCLTASSTIFSRFRHLYLFSVSKREYSCSEANQSNAILKIRIPQFFSNIFHNFEKGLQFSLPINYSLHYVHSNYHKHHLKYSASNPKAVYKNETVYVQRTVINDRIKGKDKWAGLFQNWSRRV